ncbi:MAG: Uncharacterized protein CEN87_13 [Parcubacteria group bacterium Licking1014_1]|nr:MAG: Uncharacterized protein CEN87_13 [Parcubacteria group bacterium Licking1014_1]
MNFFSSILKQKKITIFVLLFSFAFYLISPVVSFAVNGGPLMNNLGPTNANKSYDDTKKNDAEEMGYIMDGVTNAVGYIILAISYVPQKMGRSLFKWVISPSFTKASFTAISGPNANPVVAAGWPRVRDLANMFIVLGFVVIGIATTLRIQDYQAKKLLPKLIIAALLINFSLVICGIFIDGSNIAMKSFADGGGYTTDSWSQSLEKQAESMDAEKTAIGRMSVVGGIVFFNIMAAIIFLLFFFLLMARYIALWILVMLSPLAFVCYVFPFTKKFFEMWWSNFFAWCIIGIPATFFLWTADVVTDGIKKSMQQQIPQEIPIADYVIPGILLIAGFLFSIQISAMGAGFITGAAKSLTGKAKAMGWSGVKGAGGALANITGASRAGQGAKDWTTQKLENLNLLNKGTTRNKQRSRLDKVSKGLEAAYGDNPEGNAELAKLASGRAISARARDQKTASAELLAKRKAFDYVAKDKQEAVAAYATARGVTKETFTKDRPDLMTTTPAGIKEKLLGFAPGTKEAKKTLLKEERAKLETRPELTTMSSKERKKWIKERMKKYKSSMPDEAIEAKKREMAKAKTQERKLGAIPVTDADVLTRAKEDYKPTADEIADAEFDTEIPAAEISKIKTDLTSERTAKGLPAATDDEARAEYLKRHYKPSTGALLETKKKLVTEKAKEKTLDFKYATREEARQDSIDKKVKKLKDKGLSGYALDTEIKKHSDSLTPDKIEDELTALNKEKEEKAISKLSVSKFRELPESQIDAKLAEHSNYGTLERASLEFTKELKDKYKTLIPELSEKLTSSLSLAKTASDKDIKEAVEKLDASGTKTDKELAEKARGIARKMKLIDSW